MLNCSLSDLGISDKWCTVIQRQCKLALKDSSEKLFSLIQIHVFLVSTLLKNKGASRWRTFLSKWFHKEPLTSEEPFCFTKGSLWWKKVLQIIKRQGRDGSLKNLWLNGSLGNQKWFFYGIAWRTFWSTFIFKSVNARGSSCEKYLNTVYQLNSWFTETENRSHTQGRPLFPLSRHAIWKWLP